MSELIDRQALLNEYDKAHNGPPGKARKLIEDAPTASPWHRVEDGLPDKYTQCLVADADGKCAVGYYRYDCEAWDSPAFGWIENENRIYIDDIYMGIGKEEEYKTPYSGECWIIRLYCYVVGPSRHYEWNGRNLLDAVKKAEKEIYGWFGEEPPGEDE